jgi:hypothetical protein
MESIWYWIIDNLPYLTIPFVSAFVGWITNVVAIKMTFYPIEFVGVKPFGWQGIVPSKAKKMAETGVDFHIRFPLIPKINDSKENVEKTAKFAKSLGAEWVDILPYHAFAGQKYRLFSLDFPFPIGEGYPEEKIKNIREIFESFGLKTTIGG